ncbi:MAG: biopolymer transporter ExbD [Planctomycetaceae bacterium]
MKIRGRHADEKIETQMSAMIDIVFQLLIFFMLTLKIVAEEGDFDINMPVSQSSQQADPEPKVEYKVRLLADADGNLRDIRVGEVSMGNQVPSSFDRLNQNVFQWVRSGGGFSDDLEVEIDADYNLHYRYVIKAIAACTGRMDGEKKTKFLEKIKFAPPRRQGAAG